MIKICQVAKTTTNNKLQRKLVKNSLLVKQSLAKNPILGKKVQRALVKEKDDTIRRCLSNNKNLLPEIQLLLIQWHPVLMALNENLCLEAQQKLLFYSTDVKYALALNTSLKLEIFEKLFAEFHEDMLLMIKFCNFKYQNPKIMQQIEKFKILL